MAAKARAWKQKQHEAGVLANKKNKRYVPPCPCSLVALAPRLSRCSMPLHSATLARRAFTDSTTALGRYMLHGGLAICACTPAGIPVLIHLV